jgi:hypothetical protein
MNYKKVFLLLVIASALAVFEIQIEGSAGWAKNLPCWRATPGSWQQIIYGLVMNGKPCDGFHLAEIFLLLTMFHLPYVYGAKWGKVAEFETLANFFTMSICWDFLWFILNPAFGWSKFDAVHIWWHMRWIGPFPTDYYGGIATVAFIAVVAGLLAKDRKAVRKIILENSALVGLTAILAVLVTLA